MAKPTTLKLQEITRPVKTFKSKAKGIFNVRTKDDCNNEENQSSYSRSLSPLRFYRSRREIRQRF